MQLWTEFTTFCINLFIKLSPKFLLDSGSYIKTTLLRDIKCGVAAVKILFYSYIYKRNNATALSFFEKSLQKYPNKACFIFEDQEWTFQQVEDFSNKIGHVFKEFGYQKGDVFGLVMTNRAEYAAIWLGLAKIGVITALINTNLRGKSLEHCINSASCKAIIFSEDLEKSVADVRDSLGKSTKYFKYGSDSTIKQNGVINLQIAVKSAPSTYPEIDESINYNDHLMYIYTSGTTGLPKAAIVPHSRFVMMAVFVSYLIGLRPDDVVYDPLPLYHTAGGLVGVGSALAIGLTTVIRGKFSASSYIADCIKYNCTVGQYIGEICRYVLAVPEKPTDKQHKLRMIFGNGLRPAIWKQFIKRFNISNIMEVYGSTEGNLQFVNIDNTIGAVGIIPKWLPFSKYIGAIIKVDPDTMDPIRGPDGLCIECAPDEPGMFVGLIPSKSSVKEFSGYLDKAESKKKFIFNVFSKGDKAFISGDLMVVDKYGYLYFKDRTGDTYRWKGENVSTSEVEALISSVVGLRDCIVYGVEVGDAEGRAGMAAIVDPKMEIDLSKLGSALDGCLPKYAQPLFLRILSSVEITGTFKLKKMTLVKEGFDTKIVRDPLYVRKGSTYIKLTEELYHQIITGAFPV